ncbi:MAG: hypothetical protein ACRDD7_03215 [Peptostreptococcaceae bacterium]
MNLRLLQEEVYGLISSYNAYADYLPTECDFINNIYLTYSLGSISGNGYRNEIPLTIQVISCLDNKLDCQSLAFNIDKILHKNYIASCNAIIAHPNVWFVPLSDLEEDKEIITLQYYIYKYNN